MLNNQQNLSFAQVSFNDTKILVDANFPDNVKNFIALPNLCVKLVSNISPKVTFANAKDSRCGNKIVTPT